MGVGGGTCFGSDLSEDEFAYSMARLLKVLSFCNSKTTIGNFFLKITTHG